jgi:tripartite-type tricarboxylate transporter receptor subunit TctC
MAARTLMAVCAVISTFISFASAADDPFPTRGVKLILPFPAGSTLDSLSRLVAESLTARWGQSVTVENFSGAGGNIGTDRFARSEPDGYTLMATPPGPLTINKLLYKGTNYDATTFEPITLMATVPNVLVVRSNLPAKTVSEFITMIRTNPGKVTYATQGVGSTAYLTAKLFEKEAGATMLHVPYRGAAPALADIAAGHIDMMFDTIVTSMPLHQGGSVQILALADTDRSAALPDVPTIAESGMPGFRSISWFAMVAPPKTPSSIVDKINRDVVTILKSPDVSARLKNMMLAPVGSSAQEARTFFSVETAQWAKLITDLQIEPQ